MLQELRVVETGVQLLVGFLLTLPFTQAFGSLDAGQKTLYLSLVVVAGLAVGTRLTPIAVHRRVFGDHEKERPVKVGHVLVQVVIGAIATLIVGGAVLVCSVVTPREVPPSRHPSGESATISSCRSVAHSPPTRQNCGSLTARSRPEPPGAARSRPER